MSARVQDSLTNKSYDFHGICRLNLHSADPHVVRHFQAEYGAFEVGSLEDADIDVTVGPFSMDVPAAATTFGRFVISDDWVYARERYKVARWHFALTAP